MLAKAKLGNKVVPLKSIHYQANIHAGFCKLSMTHTYINITDNTIETSLKFRISKEHVITRLLITTSDKQIQGKIIPKEKAEEQYEASKVKGDTGVLIMIDSPQILNILIGKINPSEKVIVEIEFGFFLKVEDESWCLRIPMIIGQKTHRYTKRVYDLENEVEINCEALVVCNGSPISRLTSPSHKFSIITKSANEYVVKFDKITAFKGAQDIVLLYRYECFKSAFAMYEQANGEYAYSICLTPSYSENKADKLDTDPTGKYQDSLLQGSGEYIFLLDRSGSMGGTKIKMASQALILFLKSLPMRSFYNIILFNDRSTPFYPESVEYNEKNVAHSINKIEKIATKKSTELLKSLSFAYKSKTNTKYPKTIFIITDGAVKNKSDVIKLIKENESQAIVHCIGIGKDADEELVMQSSLAGNGQYRMVTKIDEISEKIIELLSFSIKPAFTNIKMQWGNQEPLMQWPIITNIPYICMGKPLFMCAIFKKKLDAGMKITCQDTSDWSDKEFTIPLETFHINQCENLAKIIAMNALTNSKEEDKLQIALKYQLLTDQTAMFASIKQTNVTTTETEFVDIKFYKEVKKKEVAPRYGKRVHYDTSRFKAKKTTKAKKCLKKSRSRSRERLQDDVKPDYSCESCESNEDDEINCEETENIDRKLFIRIVLAQSLNGSWDRAYIKEFSLKESVVDSEIPDKLKHNMRIWVTLLVIAILKIKFKPIKGEWSLIIKKALNYLKSEGVTYKDYKVECKKLII